METTRAEQDGEAFVSTGRLPSPDRVDWLLAEAHRRYASNTEGHRAQVYPALARAPLDRFGICLVGTDGRVHAVGDAAVPFSLMSISKPFVFALVCQVRGAEAVRLELGVNATGRAFDSVAAVDHGPDGRTNPMVNAGALATTSRVPGDDAEAKWRLLHDGLSRFAGRPLALDREIYDCATATNHRNRGIAWILEGLGRLGCDATTTTDLYTRQCSLAVTAHDLATMGATLADGGVNPETRVRVVDADVCRYTLAVMATAGMYETSGDWLYDVGVPGKSGIGGGIVAVAPGKGGLGTFAPALDAAGNSVKGRLAARFLARELGLTLFASAAMPIVSAE